MPADAQISPVWIQVFQVASQAAAPLLHHTRLSIPTCSGNLLAAGQAGKLEADNNTLPFQKIPGPRIAINNTVVQYILISNKNQCI